MELQAHDHNFPIISIKIPHIWHSVIDITWCIDVHDLCQYIDLHLSFHSAVTFPLSIELVFGSPQDLLYGLHYFIPVASVCVSINEHITQ